MLFEPVHFANQIFGYRLEVDPVVFFFGTLAATRPTLAACFPEYEFCHLRQVHGTEVILANPAQLIEADAHYTTRATRALAVQTADCVPVLLASKNQVSAVHAGWRGVAMNIVARAVASFGAEKVLWAGIGPHIGRRSFQVGRDVEQELSQAARAVNLTSVSEPDPTDHNRAYVDLNAIVTAQIHAAAGPAVEIFKLDRDTKTDPEFHSFRRDQTSAGRNLSFVVLNA